MRVLRYLLIATLLFLGLPVLAPLSLNAAPAAATLAATASGPFNPNVVITSPLIVSELHGQAKVMGTANLPNMHNYFLETRLLNEDGSLPSDDVAWVPASLPSSTPVQDSLLATWDTTKVPAGVYELRLTVTTDNLPSAYFVVAPLRVNSEVAATQTANSGVTQGAPDAIPRVTANTTTYIRTGDSQAFAVLGYMQAGTGGVVLGVSSIGSGWYYVQLDNGVFGWVPPSAMTSSGDFSHVPPVVPPQSARRGPTPVSSNLVLNGMALSPSAPVCAGIFNVQVNVVNSGNTPSAAATVTVQDIHVASGTVTASGTGNVPSLNPNTNFVVVVSLTDTMYYNEAHLVRAIVGNSQVTATYTLGQGSCNLTPTPTAASPTAVPPSPTRTTVPPTSTATTELPSPTGTTAPPTSTATTELPSPTATVGTPSVP